MFIFLLLLNGCGVYRDAKSYRNYWNKESINFNCLYCAMRGISSKVSMDAESGDFYLGNPKRDRHLVCEKGHNYWVFFKETDREDRKIIIEYKIVVWEN